MSQLPEQQEGTPAAHRPWNVTAIAPPEPPAPPKAAPTRARKPRRLSVSAAWDDIGPVHGPDLPATLNRLRTSLAPGWRYRLVCGRGFRTVRTDAPPPPLQLFPDCLWRPEPDRGRKTEDVPVEVGSISLRCIHDDGRRAVAVWAWRADTQTWGFDEPAYAWMPGMPHYECGAREWAELVRWTPEEVAA